jgi:hypothetical protein
MEASRTSEVGTVLALQYVISLSVLKYISEKNAACVHAILLWYVNRTTVAALDQCFTYAWQQ